MLTLVAMVIAVNACCLAQGTGEGAGLFTGEVLKQLTAQQPEHEFHLLFDRPFDQRFIYAANIKAHVLSPAGSHALLRKYWFDVKVPSLLKKIKADVFFSPDGRCSLGTDVPQCMMINDLTFLQYPYDDKKSHLLYYRHYTPKFLRKAKNILTVSNFSKNVVIQQYRIDEAKIQVVYSGVNEIFQPTNFDEQSLIKEKFTGGAEFFLYAGAIHPRKNLINLLKAFSIFKRRMHSSMKLVLAGRLAWKNNKFLELLKTYKYKDDIVLTGYVQEAELCNLMGAAYAFVYPSMFESFGVPVMEAMRCGVPVLTSKDSAMEEISKGAALYFDPLNVDDIADKLMMVYKDEAGRKVLTEKGLVMAQKNTWQRTSERVWENLITAASHNFNP